MSRAKMYVDPTGVEHWFDYKSPADVKHLELLADVTRIDLDDILEENLSQRQVLYRLHQFDNLIPENVLVERRERREQARQDPACRICSQHGWECDGRITRHHFVPKWLMRELAHYNRYAARSKCTIPVCVGRHQDLHYRGIGDKSIADYLTDEERALTEAMLKELKEERPVIFDLMASGTTDSYEYSLIRDFQLGKFREDVVSSEEPARQVLTVGQAGA
jgi:hypothetical protein